MKNKMFRGICLHRMVSGLMGILPVISSIQSQSISWAVVNAAGFEYSDQGSLHWTAGETFTAEISSADGSMRIGFLPFEVGQTGSTFTQSFDPAIKITMYPNPADDILHVQVPAMHRQSVRILSIDGRSSVQTDITSTLTLDIRSLPSGSYALYVIDPSGSFNSTTFIKS